MTNIVRKDLYKINLHDNSYLLVFHKTYNEGFGPAFSLYIGNKEFMKFDCYGENKGHYHIYNKNSQLIYFNEKTCEEQIDKSIDELLNNVNTYIKLSSDKKIKNFNINIEILKSKTDELKNKMLEYEKFYSHLR